MFGSKASREIREDTIGGELTSEGSLEGDTGWLVIKGPDLLDKAKLIIPDKKEPTDPEYPGFHSSFSSSSGQVKKQSQSQSGSLQKAC